MSTADRAATADANPGDMLYVSANESATVYRAHTRYSRYKRPGRRMPTFKQFAFFLEAANRWTEAKFVAKVDDDSLVNLPLLMVLHLYPAEEDLLLGSIHWTCLIPYSDATGVRMDRCAFGWSASASIGNVKYDRCDEKGGTLPLPYAAGAGYALLRRIVGSADVRAWLSSAQVDEHVQWQKNEDATTGYMVRYTSPLTRYVDFSEWNHVFRCRGAPPPASTAPQFRKHHCARRKVPGALPSCHASQKGGSYDISECLRFALKS